MTKLDDFLNRHGVQSTDSLQHFVELPYDPVKAHEYYLKTRDLKGKAGAKARTTSGMSQQQKEAWAYTKNRIKEDKTKQTALAKTTNEQKIEAFRTAAAATRERISGKLKLLSDKLSDTSGNTSDTISAKLKSDLANVPHIPKGVSGAERTRLVEARNKKIADIRDKAGADRATLSNTTADSSQANSASADSEKEKATSDLQAIIAKTSDAYDKSKVTLDTSYEAIYAKEYQKVLSTVAGKPKAVPKAKAASKSNGSSASKSNGSSAKKASPKKAKAKAPKKPKESKNGIIYYTKAEMAYNRSH